MILNYTVITQYSSETQVELFLAKAMNHKTVQVKVG